MIDTEMEDFDLISGGTTPAFRSAVPSGGGDAWEFHLPIKSFGPIEIRGLFEDLHDKIQRLESDFVRMQNQLKRSNQHGHSHCRQFAEVCKDLENYFFRDTGLLITSLAKEDRCAEPVQNSSTDFVKELLHNFREEIERQGKRTESRLNQMEVNLTEFKQTLEQHRNQTISEIRTYVDEYTQNMLRRFSLEGKTNVEGSHRSLAEPIAMLKCEITNKLDQMQTLFNENIDMRIQDLRAEFTENAALKAASSAKVESLQHYVHTLEASLRETVNKWDIQQVQLSHNAHDTQSRIQQQQNELQYVKKALQEHREQIVELQGNAPLHGAFQEIKDWLIDLEKRAVNHGGMQEKMQCVEVELDEIQKKLHLATMKAE